MSTRHWQLASPLGSTVHPIHLSVLPSQCGPTKARRTVCILASKGPGPRLPGEILTRMRRQPWPPYIHTQSEIPRHFCISSTTTNGQATRPSHSVSNQESKKAGKSVSQNRLQIWPPSRLSQPPPASRDTVAVGADPGSEISITLGTDCTAFPHPHCSWWCATSCCAMVTGG
jgi:hypothetical protein